VFDLTRRCFMINQLKEELQKLKEEEFDGARAKAL
jgi:hypothetical protein